MCCNPQNKGKLLYTSEYAQLVFTGCFIARMSMDVTVLISTTLIKVQSDSVLCFYFPSFKNEQLKKQDADYTLDVSCYSHLSIWRNQSNGSHREQTGRIGFWVDCEAPLEFLSLSQPAKNKKTIQLSI